MFELDLRSRKSIYEQIMDNLKELIMSEKLPFGTKLPSVRYLSKQISVNPNTVQKAYRELERQGYIYTQSGMGTFVADKKGIKADNAALTKAEQSLEDAFKQLDKAYTVAVYCRSGNRSKDAAKMLSLMGYNVVELDNGYKAWVESGR
jgi:GntR family transcriptional regulator